MSWRAQEPAPHHPCRKRMGKNSGTEPCRFEGDVVTPERSVVLSLVAERLAANRPGHPLRVGIDGVCGSGKTTFSLDLARFVAASGRTAVLVDSDGFHHVRARRYRQGRESAQGYYDDAYDFDSLTDRVLLPSGRTAQGTTPSGFTISPQTRRSTTRQLKHRLTPPSCSLPPSSNVTCCGTYGMRPSTSTFRRRSRSPAGSLVTGTLSGARPQLAQHTKPATWRPAGSTSLSKTRAGGHRFSSTTRTLTHL